MNTQIVQGSITAMSQQSNKSLAETFTNADVIVLVDVSGSMDTHDSTGGKTRYQVACSELADLQKSLPGKIAVFGFSDTAEFCPGGVPFFQGSGTNMVKALNFVKIADLPGMRFILISDGEPNDPEQTMNIARSFNQKIDVIYVGPEDRPSGRNYLNALAKATGGKAVQADRAKELAASVKTLLLEGK